MIRKKEAWSLVHATTIKDSYTDRIDQGGVKVAIDKCTVPGCYAPVQHRRSKGASFISCTCLLFRGRVFLSLQELVGRSIFDDIVRMGKVAWNSSRI